MSRPALVAALLCATAASAVSLPSQERAEARAREMLDAIRTGDAAAARLLFHEEFRALATDAVLQQQRTVAGEEAPVAFETVSFWRRTRTSSAQGFKTQTWVEAEYQVQTSRRHYLVRAVLLDPDGAATFRSFGILGLPGDLRQLNAWTFAGKGETHYFVFALALGVFAFIAYALVRCLRSRLRYKWAWAAFAALGVGGVALDWTSGVLSLQVCNVTLLGVSALRASDFAPWRLAVGFPLGAIFFFLKLWSVERAEADAAAAAQAEAAKPRIDGAT